MQAERLGLFFLRLKGRKAGAKKTFAYKKRLKRESKKTEKNIKKIFEKGIDKAREMWYIKKKLIFFKNGRENA